MKTFCLSQWNVFRDGPIKVSLFFSVIMMIIFQFEQTLNFSKTVLRNLMNRYQKKLKVVTSGTKMPHLLHLRHEMNLPY